MKMGLTFGMLADRLDIEQLTNVTRQTLFDAINVIHVVRAKHDKNVVRDIFIAAITDNNVFKNAVTVVTVKVGLKTPLPYFGGQ